MSISRTGARALDCTLVLFIVALAGVPTPVVAQVPPHFDEALKEMLEAVRTGSYAQFVAPGDPGFKTGFTQQMFATVSRQLGPRLKEGYSATYFGQLRQQDYVVYVWKLGFDDGKDDYLLTMFTRAGKVSGFVPR